MFVYGTQYLRGFTPEKDQWERDMENMKKIGFNTIRAWLVWNALERREGEIDYEYLNDFLECAGRYDLQVGLLFHLHACPAWAVKKFSKYFYVSESHTDFIFSIIGEELGCVGCCLVLGLFALLIMRGIYIGMRARERFGALLAFGIMMQIGLQVALNVAVVTDTLPNTGISLPFFSYGGSSTLVTLGEMGFLLSVSRQADLPRLYSFSKSKKQKV